MYKFNKAEILENGVIQLRQQEVLELADGTTRDGGYHRKCYTPDMDIETIDCPQCKTLATATWTQEVVDTYKAKLAEQQAELEPTVEEAPIEESPVE